MLGLVTIEFESLRTHEAQLSPEDRAIMRLY